jgi:23S rRNA (guanosine2251-2'-O)-methyltransferase
MKESGKRIIYGVNPVVEALRSGSETVERVVISTSKSGASTAQVVAAAKASKVRIDRVPRAEVDRLAEGAKHQGVVAVVVGKYSYTLLEELIEAWQATGEPAFFVILDSIQDPQNLGSLIRGADCAGAHGIIITKDRSAKVTPAVAKASAGATAHVAVTRVTNLTRAIELLKEAGVWVTALEAGEGSTLYDIDLTSNTAIVLGSEGAGVRRLVKERCDHVVSLPIAGGVNSLSAAQAGVVSMFEVMRQRMG